jgi:hypothetical protein
LNEGELDEAGEVLGRFVEAGNDSPRLLEPSIQSFDDVSGAKCLAIELDEQRCAPSTSVTRG